MAITPENLAVQIAAELAAPNWFELSIFGAISFLLMCITAYTTKYMSAKAQITISTAHFEDLQRQLKDTTTLTQSIKSKIEHSGWIEKSRVQFIERNLDRLVSLVARLESENATMVETALDNKTHLTVPSAGTEIEGLQNLYLPELKEPVTKLLEIQSKLHIHVGEMNIRVLQENLSGQIPAQEEFSVFLQNLGSIYKQFNDAKVVLFSEAGTLLKTVYPSTDS